MANNPEQLKGGPEVGRETSEAAAEQAERLKNRFEKGVETSPEQQAERAEKARFEASREALMSKEAGGAEKRQATQGSAPTFKRVSKKEKDKEFNETMKSVRTHLSAPERTFSKFVHNKAVEKTSDVVGATVARPNAILAGSISAFILTGAVYIIARTFGYPLSGFETIGAFMIGFVLGILFDFFRVMITGKRA